MCVTVKHGGTSVMVWGAMGYNGIWNLHFVDGIMNKDIYLDILKKRESEQKLGIENTGKYISFLSGKRSQT